MAQWVKCLLLRQRTLVQIPRTCAKLGCQWVAINDDRNRIIDGEQPITHRPLDARHRVVEEDEFIFENPEPEPIDEEEEMPLDDDYIWDEDIEPEDYE